MASLVTHNNKLCSISAAFLNQSDQTEVSITTSSSVPMHFNLVQFPNRRAVETTHAQVTDVLLNLRKAMAKNKNQYWYKHDTNRFLAQALLINTSSLNVQD